MKVLVITSCTGMKAVTHERQLTIQDFRKGAPHVRARERELEHVLRQARAMYTGRQHTLLCDGIAEAERRVRGIDIELQIVSAGYGVIPADRMIAPYEATFSEMPSREIALWGKQLDIPQDIENFCSEGWDLVLILLGDPYLKAAAFETIERFEAPTLLFCSTAWSKKLEPRQNLHIVPLYNPDATRFHCGLTALKGELAARVLCLLGQVTVRALLGGGSSEILNRLYSTGPVSGKSSMAV